jgi:ribonuclease P protein component
MLPRRNRYPIKLGVPRTVVQSPFFVFRFQKNNEVVSRFAVVVSKKIDPKATGRNRIRRIFSEALLRMMKEQEMLIDGIFYVRKPVASLNLDETYQQIKTLFKKHAIIQL